MIVTGNVTLPCWGKLRKRNFVSHDINKVSMAKTQTEKQLPMGSYEYQAWNPKRVSYEI